MASKVDLTVELPDGMVVGYAEVGDAEGPPVIVLPGTPGPAHTPTSPATPAPTACLVRRPGT